MRCRRPVQVIHGFGRRGSSEKLLRFFCIIEVRWDLIQDLSTVALFNCLKKFRTWLCAMCIASGVSGTWSWDINKLCCIWHNS